MADDHHAIADELHEQVGKALSHWSHVEESLCDLFVHAILKSPSDAAGPAANAFWAVMSFEGKLAMADAAIQFRAAKNECILGEWKAISNALSAKAKKRNELAHGTVITVKYIDEQTGKSAKRTVFIPSLYRGFYKSMEKFAKGEIDLRQARDPWPKVRLNREDIKRRRKGFDTINDRISQFRERFIDAIKPPQEDREPSAEADQETRTSDSQTQ